MDKDSAYKRYVYERFFNEKEIWKKENSWSSHTRKTIQLNIDLFFEKFPIESKTLILNAGSGNTNYEFGSEQLIHLDIIKSKVSQLNRGVVADLEKLPFANETFTHLICVGSVINYCDPLVCISEFSRVLKRNGKILIDFDSSDSHEFIFSKKYGASASFVNTFYNDLPDQLFVYSRTYLLNILKLNSLHITIQRPYHIVSPLVYFLTRSEKISGIFGKFDSIINKYNLPNSKSSSVAFFCEKRG